jgi:hypothetical protein
MIPMIFLNRTKIFVSVGMLAAALGGPSKSEAGLDYQFNSAGRTYPIAAFFGGQVGWSEILWGERSPTAVGAPEWRYGYVRPNVQAQTIGLTHRLSAEVEVFPISILGFAVGSNRSIRNLEEYPDFDCKTLVCDGTVNRDHFRVTALSGVGAWAFVGSWRRDQMYTRDEREFFDDGTTLKASGRGDRSIGWVVAASWASSEMWRWGLAQNEQFLDGDGQPRNQSVLGFAQRSWGEHRLTLSAGRFESTHQSPGLTLQFGYTYLFQRGPGLLP